MGSWRKLLGRMLADTKPNSYTYDDAARVLRQLGFVESPGGGSHRVWRRDVSGHGVRIGLCDSGRGPLKAVYIKEMLATLRAFQLVPTMENADDVDD
jgi:hypothetical protein